MLTSMQPHSAYMKLSTSQTSLNSISPGSFTKERLASGVYIENRPFVAYRQMKDLVSFPRLKPIANNMYNRCSSQLKIFVKGSIDENGRRDVIIELPSDFDVETFGKFQACCRGFLARLRFEHRKKRNDAILTIQRNAEVFIDCSKDSWFKLLWSLRPIINAKFDEEEFIKLNDELDSRNTEIQSLTSENDSYKQEIHRLESLLDEHNIVPSNDLRFLKIDRPTDDAKLKSNQKNQKYFEGDFQRSQQVGLLNEEFHNKESRLNEKVTTLTEQLDQLQKRLDKEIQTKKELEGMRDDYHKRMTSAEATNDYLTNRLSNKSSNDQTDILQEEDFETLLEQREQEIEKQRKLKQLLKESEEKIASQNEQIEKLNDQIKELLGSPDMKSRLEAEIARLNKINAEQGRQIMRYESFMEEQEELSQELKSTKERVKRLRHQLTTQQSENEDELVSLRSQWQKRMESVQEQLESETEAKDKLLKSNRDLERKLIDEKSKSALDTEDNDSQADEDARMKKDLMQTRLELDKLRAEYEIYQTDNKAEELKQRISELELLLESTQKDKDSLIGENAVLTVKLENITTSLEELESRHKNMLNDKSKRLSEKQTELIDVQKKMIELESQANRQYHEISAWEQKYNQLEVELQKTKVNGSNGEPTSPFKISENLEKDQTISRLENRCKDLESEKIKIQEVLDETQEDNENLQKDLDELQSTINQERSAHRKLKNKLVEYQERADNAELKFAQSERRRTDLQEDLDRVNKLLEEARSEIAELQTEVTHLRRFHMTSGSLRRHESMRSLGGNHHQHGKVEGGGDHMTDSQLNVPSIDVQDCSDESSSENEEEQERRDNLPSLSSGASLTDIVRQNELLCQADRLISKGRRDRRGGGDSNNSGGSLSRSQSFRQISSLPKHMTGATGLQRTHSFQEGIDKKTPHSRSKLEESDT